MKKIKYSIVATCFNEEKNLDIFVKEVAEVMKKIPGGFEIIVVDDGSIDKSFSVLSALKKKYSQLVIIKLRRNFGQSAATLAGFNQVQGKIIIALDADLQNDPEDIPLLLEKIKQGFEVVSGWRHKRPTGLLYKIILKIGEYLRKLVIGFEFHDAASTPNAYKKETLQNLELYGEMHRFLVPILYWQGYKVCEVKVKHRMRKYGQSHYSFFKSFRGFLDLLLVKFWQSYATRPIQVFGVLGLFFSFIGFLLGLEEAVRKLVFGLSIYNRTLPLLAVFLVILGVQFIAIGILADIMVRNYYKDRNTYFIEKIS